MEPGATGLPYAYAMTFRGDLDSIGGGARPHRQFLVNGHLAEVTPGPAHSPFTAVYVEPKQRSRESTHIVYGRVKQFQWEGAGLLSIKTAFEGDFLIESGGGLHHLEPSRYLVINRGQSYKTLIDSSSPVETLSVFFEPKVVRDSVRTFAAGHADQIDDPFGDRFDDPVFFERCFEPDTVMEQLVRIHEELPTYSQDGLWASQRVHELVDRLVERYAETWGEVDRAPAIRSATKEELYRRLYKARDYAEASLGESVTLDDLAYVACLSTNYFLRSFRSLFGVTPHQFVMELRLKRASRLLRTTSLSVSEICQAVGFQSLGSFSWLFRRKMGASPDHFRRSHHASLL